MRIELKTHPLDQSCLYKLVRKAKLAGILGITDAELRRLTKHADKLYREKKVLKKDGSLRDVEDPADALKKVQRRLAVILGKITPPDFLYCPVKRRSYVTNAAQHRGHRVVKTLDIKKYFPSTKATRVFWFFETIMKCDRAMAGILTKLTCYQDFLPTGSPLSPIMAYFAHIDMWTDIAEICRVAGVTLTVYADDVTVSGDRVPESVMWQIRQRIKRTGHQYHKEKAFIDQPAEITGVFVDGDRLVAPHKQFRKLRLAKNALGAARGEVDTKIVADTLAGLQGQLEQIRVADLR